MITFYSLKFPHAQLGIMLRYFYQYGWIKLPAWSAFLLWILFQIIGAYQQHAGFSAVSSLAHLGGVAVGVAAWATWRKLDATPENTQKEGLLVTRS